MNIKIYCVGKIKEKFYKDAIDEYLKRLSKYAKVSVIEVTDEKTPDKASSHEEELIKEKEGKRILSKINDTEYLVALAIDGKSYDSLEFAKAIENTGINGISNISFVIGGSLGLSKEVLDRANKKISFSKMTFPHQLMRVILLEQIYRAFRIINNEPYHK